MYPLNNFLSLLLLHRKSGTRKTLFHCEQSWFLLVQDTPCIKNQTHNLFGDICLSLYLIPNVLCILYFCGTVSLRILKAFLLNLVGLQGTILMIDPRVGKKWMVDASKNTLPSQGNLRIRFCSSTSTSKLGFLVFFQGCC